MSCPHPGGPAVHLEALRRELAGRGWITSLLDRPGRPSGLYVQNPDPGAAVLNDHVLVAAERRGQLLVLVALGHPRRPGRRCRPGRGPRHQRAAGHRPDRPARQLSPPAEPTD